MTKRASAPTDSEERRCWRVALATQRMYHLAILFLDVAADR